METLTPAPKKRGRPRKNPVMETTEVVLLENKVEPLTIKETGLRSKLSEGREHQMGFTFLKKLNENSFETVYPISPCKDYLNDVVFSENTGKNCYAYGLNYTKQGIFTDSLAYMAMKICPHHHGVKYANQDKDVENINENFKKIEEFVNFFEDQLKLENKTEIIKTDDNLFLIKTPLFWCKYTYLISLYSLLIRCGQYYKEGDKMAYFSKFSLLGDVYNIQITMPKLNRLLKGELPEQNLNNMNGGTGVHNMGIVSFTF